MSRPLACTIACSLVLLLSVCSTRSIAADEPAAMSAAETLTAAATVRAPPQFLAFADMILPAPTRTQRVVAGFLFAQPSWLMPLPDFSASQTPVERKSAAATSHTQTVALAKPSDAAPDRSSQPTIAAQDSEPFGIQAARAPQGPLWVKWRKVQRAIKAEAPALARCRTAASSCSKAANRFVAIIVAATKHHGRDRLELVNQRINAAIRYESDMKQWHRSDRWSAPLDRRHGGSFDTGRGDCEDYAVAKYVALLEAGTQARDLRLLVVRDTSARTYHAVLAARLNGQWLLLDNRWRRLIPDDKAQFFKPLFALNAAGVTRFAAAGGNHGAPLEYTARTDSPVTTKPTRG